MHFVRHESEEMSDAHSRLEHATAGKAEPLHCVVDCADDDRSSVVCVERRGARRFQLFRGQQLLDALPLRSQSFIRVPREDLRNSAPADILTSVRFSSSVASRFSVSRRRTTSIAAKLSRHFCLIEPCPTRSSGRMR